MSSAPQPDIHITLHSDTGPPRDITFSYPLDPGYEGLLRGIRDNGNRPGLIECRMHDNDPTLADLRSADGRLHGAWLGVAKWPNSDTRLALRHWPSGPVAGLPPHPVPGRMSDEHRWKQDYIYACGDRNGYPSSTEERVSSGRKIDVAVVGTAAKMASEVQVSPISRATVVKRTKEDVAAGYVSVWFPGHANPDYRFRVPCIETNRLEHLKPGGWTVTTGPRMLEHERCNASSRIPCPDRRSGWCGGWHHMWVPMPGLAVDDVVEKVPAGTLVQLDTATAQGVILTTPADRDTFVADMLPRQRVPARGSLGGHPDYSSQRLRERITSDSAAIAAVDPAWFGHTYAELRNRVVNARPGRQNDAVHPAAIHLAALAAAGQIAWADAERDLRAAGAQAGIAGWIVDNALTLARQRSGQS